MRIAIDARSLTTRPTGIGHYLMAAVNVWSEQRPDIDFVLLAHKPLHEAAAPALRRAANVRFHACPPPLLQRNGVWWFLWTFQRAARRLAATHLWGAGGQLPLVRGRGAPGLLTVHDLVWRSLPETMALRTRLAYGLFGGRSIRTADLIWTVSHHTAREVERHYPRRRSRGFVVGSGLNPLRVRFDLGAAELAAIAERYRVTPRTLLFVGTLEPRKNLRFLLSLMPGLARQGCDLLVVGCSGWGRSDVAEVVAQPGFPRESVRFCDYVGEPDLQGLYRVVAFFVSTSLLEGFGLPHLEAMACGCPVIAAANSAVVEVVGSGGVLVEGWDPAGWTGRIAAAFERRDALSAAARESARRHSIETACRAVSRALEAGARLEA